jgi:hypothetical protein
MVVRKVSEPAIDFSDITPQDLAPEDDSFSVPDHTASREERRSFASYLGGKGKKEEERPTRRGRKPKRPVSRAKKGAFTEHLMGLYGMAGVAVAMRDEHCGTAILENAEKCAEALDELAYQNESVRRVLDTLVATTAFGQVVMAHAPIIIAIASHHGGGNIPFVPTIVKDDEPE